MVGRGRLSLLNLSQSDPYVSGNCTISPHCGCRVNYANPPTVTVSIDCSSCGLLHEIHYTSTCLLIDEIMTSELHRVTSMSGMLLSPCFSNTNRTWECLWWNYYTNLVTIFTIRRWFFFIVVRNSNLWHVDFTVVRWWSWVSSPKLNHTTLSFSSFSPWTQSGLCIQREYPFWVDLSPKWWVKTACLHKYGTNASARPTGPMLLNFAQNQYFNQNYIHKRLFL